MLYKSLNNIDFLKLLLNPYKEFINTNSFLNYDDLKYNEDQAWGGCYPKSTLSNKEKNNPNNLSLHFDISIASEGYVREIHLDMSHRFLNFLIYFENSEDVGGEGGELCLYNNDLSLYNVSKPKDNKAIFFFSTPQSWHSVNKMINTKKWRKFIYGGYSCSFQSFKNVGVWKNQSVSQWPNIKERKIAQDIGL